MEIDVSKKLKQQKASKRRDAFFAYLLLSPYFIVFFLFGFVPFISGFIFSLMRYDPYLPQNNSFIGLQNYKILFNLDQPLSKTFWDSFSTMFVFDAVMVPLLIVIPLALAYLINLQPPGYKFCRAIIYLPNVISMTIVGIIFSYIFNSESSGLINSLFGTEIDWLGGKPWEDDILRWVVMLIASVWWQTGGNFIIFSAALRDVPKSLYEACEMDGGGRWRKIVAVTLPNIKSSVNICLFNTLIGYLGLYAQPYMLHTLENADLLVSPMMYIQYHLMGGLEYAQYTGYFSAAAVIFGLITMVFSIIQRTVCAPHRKKTQHSEACGQFGLSRMELCGIAASSYTLGGDDE